MNIYIPSLNKEVIFSIGKNAKNNFDIIDNSEDEDIWFHLNERPSRHVVAHISKLGKLNKKQMHQVVKQGSLLCRRLSTRKRRHSSKREEVIYTQIKNVVKTNILGTVTTKTYKIYL